MLDRVSATVLIVDPEVTAADGLQHQLEAAGVTVLTAPAQDCQERVAQEQPDLVVLPPEGTHPVAEALRTNPVTAGTPVLHRGGPGAAESGADSGTVACVAKALLERRRQGEHVGAAAQEQARAGLEVAFETADVGLAVLDREQRYVRVNAVLAEIHGVPPAAHVGRTPREVLPGAPWVEQLGAELAAVMASGTPRADLELRGEVPSTPGRLRTWRIGLRPTCCGERVTGAVAVVREVTHQQLTEGNLAQALLRERESRTEAEAMEERLAFLYQVTSTLFSSPLDARRRMEQLAQVLVPSLADWCLVEVLEDGGQRQRVAVAHWSPQRAELCQTLRGPAGMVDPLAPAGLARVVRGGKAEFVPDTSALPADDGEHARLLEQLEARSYIVAPLQRGSGPAGAVMVAFSESNRRYRDEDVALVVDLAQRAAMAIDNARLFQEAERAIRARDDLLSIASHDVRAPLSALVLQAAALQKRLQRQQATPEQLSTGLEKIVTQSGRAVALLDNLLSVVRIGSGQMDLHLADVDLAQLVQDSVSRTQELLATAGCRVDLQVHGQVVGHWDHLRLEQVVNNLLSNAMKYGRGKPIEIRVAREGSAARFTVRDEGIGISAEDQRRIFERFSRATERSRGESHGLGLWIVRQIVAALGGQVAVESAPGSGATFTVELPLAGPRKL